MRTNLSPGALHQTGADAALLGPVGGLGRGLARRIGPAEEDDTLPAPCYQRQDAQRAIRGVPQVVPLFYRLQALLLALDFDLTAAERGLPTASQRRPPLDSRTSLPTSLAVARRSESSRGSATPAARGEQESSRLQDMLLWSLPMSLNRYGTLVTSIAQLDHDTLVHVGNFYSHAPARFSNPTQPSNFVH